MKLRIALWGLAGFVVAIGWAIFAMVTGPGTNPGQWMSAAITAPASLLGRIMPVSVYLFILINAVIYAMFGLAIELTRRSVFKHR